MDQFKTYLICTKVVFKNLIRLFALTQIMNQFKTTVKLVLTTTSEQWPPVYNGQQNTQLFNIDSKF
jgi:hypothetical protein